MSNALANLQFRPLYACIAALFALVAPVAMASTTWPVASCDDGGPGTLRAIVAAPTTVSGDTVDLSALTCSTISLTSDPLYIAQDSLTLRGPANRNLAIEGSSLNDSVILHAGFGTLMIDSLTISGGYYGHVGMGGDVAGGCINSLANVTLIHATVTRCEARAPADGGAGAFGGGIATQGALFVLNSTITGNSADALQADAPASGGGAFAGGDFVAKYSTISNNSALGTANVNDQGGGGLALAGNAVIANSTISDNFTAAKGGGLYTVGSAIGKTVTITNSTISQNRATNGAGLLSTFPTTLRNNTIAFNKSPSIGCGGATFDPRDQSFVVNLQSNLVANNTHVNGGFTVPSDLRSINGIHAVTFSGASNLVRATDSAETLPADTIAGICPQLGPLRNNGGSTQTHALLGQSRGIDEGNNSGGFSTDQRGGAHARVAGTQADIGAYEYQVDDIVFGDGFEQAFDCSG